MFIFMNSLLILDNKPGEKFCLCINEKKCAFFLNYELNLLRCRYQRCWPHSLIYCKDTVYSSGSVRWKTECTIKSSSWCFSNAACQVLPNFKISNRSTVVSWPWTLWPRYLNQQHMHASTSDLHLNSPKLKQIETRNLYLMSKIFKKVLF